MNSQAHPGTGAGGVDHPGAFGEVWGLNKNWGALKEVAGSGGGCGSGIQECALDPKWRIPGRDGHQSGGQGPVPLEPRWAEGTDSLQAILSISTSTLWFNEGMFVGTGGTTVNPVMCLQE